MNPSSQSSFSQWVERYMNEDTDEVPISCPLDLASSCQKESSDNDNTSTNGKNDSKENRSSINNNDTRAKLKWGILGSGRVCHDFGK